MPFPNNCILLKSVPLFHTNLSPWRSLSLLIRAPFLPEQYPLLTLGDLEDRTTGSAQPSVGSKAQQKAALGNAVALWAVD